jgi:hypothetical protein
MGFRDYNNFNQALLAKQAWCLATALESLCARVLHALYSREGDFMNVGWRKRAPYTWKSIMHGRDFLKERMIWRVGNGEKID